MAKKAGHGINEEGFSFPDRPMSAIGGLTGPIHDLEIRYFGAARAAAGTDSEKRACTEHTTIEDLLIRITTEHPALAAVLPRCSYLVDGAAVRRRSLDVAAARTLDVLPPFAGG